MTTPPSADVTRPNVFVGAISAHALGHGRGAARVGVPPGQNVRPVPSEHPAFVARLFFGSAMLVTVAIGIAAVSGLDWSVRLSEWWLAALFAVVFALQLRFRIDAGNAMRRTNEALSEGPIVIGLFWLEPWTLILSLLFGAFIAFNWMPETTWRWRVFNLAAQLLVYVVVARVVVWIDAANPHDGYRAVLVAVAVWLVADLVRMVPHVTMSWARWRALRPELMRSSFAPTKTRAMAAAVGLVIAVALEASPWTIVPIVPLLVMFYMSAANASRVASLELGIEQLSRLTAATNNASDLDHIERALLESEGAVAGLQVSGVASPINPDEPDGAVAWIGDVSPEVRSYFKSVADLRAIADGEEVRAPGGSGTLGVWCLDEVSSRFLVIFTPRTSRLKDLWSLTAHLVSNARLAMANVRQQTTLVEVADREYWRARTDESTGLPNEYAARVELDRRLDAGIRAPLGVVAVSLLGFKQLVDVMGQERGDEVIAAFAQRLGAADGVEFLARVGRAEFVLFATGGVDEVVELAERVRRVDAEPDDNGAVWRDASAGVAVTYPNQPISGADLLRRAGLALGKAESAGDVVVFGDAELAAEQRRVDIRLCLSEAIAQRELYPAFQPQIDLRTGAIAGLEVLARWTSPSLGVISPGEFIEVAEQSNQIERLTISMLEQALEAYSVWAAQGVTFPISVNLSATSLARPKFLELLVAIVKQSGLSAEMLTLEITESTLVESAETLEALAKLADLGVRISIDDFGTGYSSLSYLERLPVHELKIDRSMVMSVDTQDEISPVLRWLTRMGQDLGYVVVAEGIETPSQLRALQRLAIDVGQGYLFARPMAAPEMTVWLDEYRPPGHVFDGPLAQLLASSDSVEPRPIGAEIRAT